MWRLHPPTPNFPRPHENAGNSHNSLELVDTSSAQPSPAPEGFVPRRRMVATLVPCQSEGLRCLKDKNRDRNLDSCQARSRSWWEEPSSSSWVFLTQPRARGASPHPHPSPSPAFPMVLESRPREGIAAKPTKPWRAWKGAKDRDGKNSQFQGPEETTRHNKALFGRGISLGNRGEF